MEKEPKSESKRVYNGAKEMNREERQRAVTTRIWTYTSFVGSRKARGRYVASGGSGWYDARHIVETFAHAFTKGEYHNG
jgi:hypothetical protein